MNTRNQIIGTYAVKIVIAALILAAGTFLYLRLDFSRGRAYSLNPQTRETLRDLPANFLIKVYATKDLPAEYSNLNRSLNDLLKEYERVSKRRIRFEYIHGNNPEDLLQKAMDHNIRPYPLEVLKEGGTEIKFIVFGLTMESGGKISSMELGPGMESKLEYQLTKIIGRMSERSLPKVLVFADTLNLNSLRNYYPSEVDALQKELFGNFQTIQTSLDSIPEFAPVMFCMGVLDSLSQKQLYNLDQYLMHGGKIVMTQDRVAMQAMERGAVFFENPSNVFKMFEHYGFIIRPNIVLDKNCAKGRGEGLGSSVDYPHVPIVRGSEKYPYTKGFEEIYLVMASEIAPMPGSKLKIAPMLQTSHNSNTLSGPVFAVQQAVSQATDPDYLSLPPITVGAEISGTFKSYFAPDSPLAKADPGYQAETSQGKFILFADNELPLDFSAGAYIIINAIDHLMNRQDMIDLRSRNPQSSLLSTYVYMYRKGIDLADPRPLQRRLVTVFQLVSMLGPLLLLAIVGGIVYLKRRQSRLALAVPEPVPSPEEPDENT